MNTEKNFLELMATQTEIAIATSVENQPNVRIMNFYYNHQAKIMYVASFNDNEKIQEFAKNPRIAFTTIPHGGVAHVKTKARIEKSEKSIYDLENEFTSKISGYDETIRQAGEFLVLYEIKFTEVKVTMDLENVSMLKI